MNKNIIIGIVVVVLIGTVMIFSDGDDKIGSEQSNQKMMELMDRVKSGELTMEEADEIVKGISSKTETVKTEKKSEISGKLGELKRLRDCLVEAETKDQAIDCHGKGLEGYAREAVVINSGVNEWTKADKDKLIRTHSKLIDMVEKK